MVHYCKYQTMDRNDLVVVSVELLFFLEKTASCCIVFSPILHVQSMAALPG